MQKAREQSERSAYLKAFTNGVWMGTPAANFCVKRHFDGIPAVLSTLPHATDIIRVRPVIQRGIQRVVFTQDRIQSLLTGGRQLGHLTMRLCCDTRDQQKKCCGESIKHFRRDNPGETHVFKIGGFLASLLTPTAGNYNPPMVTILV
jgi:hypothetical protein